MYYTFATSSKTGSNNLALYYNHSVSAGRLLVMHVATKPETAAVTTPSGWDLVGYSAGGTGSAGNNTGPCRITVFTKLATGSEYGSSVSVSAPSANAMVGQIQQVHKDSSSDVFATTEYDTGVDTSTGTSYSATTSGTLGLTDSGKEILAVYVASTYGSSMSFSSESVSATGISSWGTQYEEDNSGTTIGNNVRALSFTSLINTGTATGPLTFTCNTSASTSGPMIALRIRVANSDYSDSETGSFSEDSVVGGDQLSPDTVTYTESETLSYVGTDRSLSDLETLLVTEDHTTDISFVDSDVGAVTELATPFIDAPQIVFNESLTNPGFDITLSGLLDGAVGFSTISVFRREPLGRYADEYVRGMHSLTVESDAVVGADYEAPLGVPLDYYFELDDGAGGLFTYGPVQPTPLPYIPTQSGAYGNGVAYLKSIDQPSNSRAVMIAEFPSWSRSVNVLATHHVLGRRNPVVVTDVVGGRKGTFTINVLMPEGQEVDEINNLINTGGVLLLQNNNYIVSGYKDMFFRITGDVSYNRLHRMVGFGPLETSAQHDIVIQMEIEFTEVDRPDTLGIVLTETTWQNVLVDDVVWSTTASSHTDWQDVADG